MDNRYQLHPMQLLVAGRRSLPDRRLMSLANDIEEVICVIERATCEVIVLVAAWPSISLLAMMIQLITHMHS